MKKRIWVLLMLVTALCMTACQTAGGGGPIDTQTKGSITVSCYEAGFGTVWLSEMAKDFQKSNKIKVNVKLSYITGELTSLVSGGLSTSDVVMSLGSFFDSQDAKRLVELSDVYGATPPGGEESVKDHMNPEIYRKLKTDDGIYQMNWANSVSGLLYNKTVLDETLGEGNYTLPNTTDELLALCGRIKDKGVYPFSLSSTTGYWDYAHLVWWAQYSGYDNYYDYYRGYYQKEADGQTVRTLADDAQVCDDPGRKEALSVASEILKAGNGYTHKYANSMDYQEAQIAFVSQGYGEDKTKAAFMICGDWFANEMQSYLINKPQDIRMMKVPMLSAIVKTLENKSLTDDQLSQAVSAIDRGEARPSFMSENDFARLKSARQMAYSATIDHAAVIPTTSKKQALAKEFLLYLASPAAGAIYSKCLNGLTLPYGYGGGESDSDYIRSRNENFKDYVPVFLDYSSPLVYRGGFGAYATNNAVLDKPLYDGQSADDILKYTKGIYSGKWDDILTKGGLK